MFKRAFVLATFSIAVLATQTSGAIETRPYLTLALAEKATAACRRLAEAEGWRLAIAIKDVSGNLVLFTRMDDTFAKASEIALLKAESASTTPISTNQMRKVALEYNDPPHGIERVPGIVVFDGGEPIKTAGGYQIGGIGVSGSIAANDGACARTAVAAIAADLK
jgi:uncharacterized protein GlcG (DUF336 family)